MSEPLRPFRAERYPIGMSADGHALAVAPMTPGAADVLGPQVAAIGPWAHYGFDATRITAALKGSGDGGIRYQIECGPDLAGAVIIFNPWLAGAYFAMLATFQPTISRHGAQVLAWLDSGARHFRNLWLCVSGFNTEAQRFYRLQRFEHVTTLECLLRA